MKSKESYDFTIVGTMIQGAFGSYNPRNNRNQIKDKML